MVATGDQFNTFREFKDAIAQWSIDEKFSYVISQSDKARVVIKCRMEECPFLVRAFLNQKDNIVQGTSSKQNWLIKNVPLALCIDNKTTPTAIVQAIQHKFNEKITAAAASKVKHTLLANSLRDQAAQYKYLPRYASAIETLYPDSYVQITVNKSTSRFQRIFICPPTSRLSFQFCRPFIAIDGTFTKTQYIQTLLLAVGIDADNHACVLAWAMVEGENEDSWRFFLLNLKLAIPEIDNPNVIVMSDRDKGLSNASDSILNLSTRAFCTQYISENVYKIFRRTAKDLFKRIAASNTQQQYVIRLEALRDHNKAAAKYVEELDKTKYCAPFYKFPGRTYGHTTSNIVESVNNMILEERALPCLDLLDSLWHKIMHQRFERLTDANKYNQNQLLTVYTQNLLKDSLTTAASQRKVQMSNDISGLVTDMKGDMFEVDLKNSHCSCGHYQENAVPCAHAIACIHYLKKQPIDYIPRNLTVEAYIDTYRKNYGPIDISKIKYQDYQEIDIQPIPTDINKAQNTSSAISTTTLRQYTNDDTNLLDSIAIWKEPDSFVTGSSHSSWIPANTPRPQTDSYVSAFGYTVFTPSNEHPNPDNSSTNTRSASEALMRGQNNSDCLPPILSAPRGRPKVIRKRPGELKRKRQVMAGQLPDILDRAPQRCGQCKQLGHNSRTCRKPPAIEL